MSRQIEGDRPLLFTEDGSPFHEYGGSAEFTMAAVSCRVVKGVPDVSNCAHDCAVTQKRTMQAEIVISQGIDEKDKERRARGLAMKEGG
jgi:hypothetical protein